MFSFPPDFQEINKKLNTITEGDVRKALSFSVLGIDGLVALLSPAAEVLLGDLVRKSSNITQQRFGRTIQLYAPLYLSSFCQNRCKYCGFSAENHIDRRVLSLDEAEAEAAILQERGFDHILLVSGEAPGRLGVEYLEKVATRLKDKFAAVSIEVQPLTTAEYKRLFEAGVSAVAIYQETYDQPTFADVHVSGPKSDYDFRLDTPARAAEAGMREVGIGALLGLANWRCEGVALAMHLDLLRKKFWQTAFTVSFPRLRPAEGDFPPLVPVGEKNLAQLIFAMRLFDPDVGLVLSTREEERFRDGMVGLGPTRYSAGSCTAPGGYSDPKLAGEQFSIGDHRSLDEVKGMIRRHGFDPVRKDWDTTFQCNSSIL